MKKYFRDLCGLLAIISLAFIAPTYITAPYAAPGASPAPEESQAIEPVPINALFPGRIPHPACPSCFKAGPGDSYGIFEEVPGTGVVLPRDLPDPAPLQPGEIRLEVHPETGQRLWYKGRQAFAGPTDEEPVSSELPIAKIEVLRIKARHERQVMSVPGVNAFGIRSNGFFVRIDPRFSTNKSRIPSHLEGIPVTVEEGEMPVAASHHSKTFRPVPVGAGLRSASRPPSDGNSSGSVGPTVVRECWNLNVPCSSSTKMVTLTAAHVVNRLDAPPLTPNTTAAVISQGSTSWGTVMLQFSLTPCGNLAQSSSCFGPNAITNLSYINPDIAGISHISTSHFDPIPSPVPCSSQNSLEPTRKLQSGTTSYVDGPTGIVQVATLSPATSVQNWGMMSHGAVGTASDIGTSIIYEESETGLWYCLTPLDGAWVAVQNGDSGGLISTYNGPISSRDVLGVTVVKACNIFGICYAYYVRAGDIHLAFNNAGKRFDHFWGTYITKWRPSNQTFDYPC